MGPLIALAVPFVVLAVLFVVCVPIVVILARAQKAERERRVAVWRAFANERGLRLLEPTGPWYRRRCWAVEGTVDGAAVRLDTYTVSSGKHQVTYTRTAAAIERSLPRILATPRSVFTSWGEALGWRTVPTGDDAFDRKLAVRSKAEDTARRVLDPDVRARALDLGRRSVSIQCKDRQVKVWWRGAEKDPLALEAACRLTAALTRSCARA